MNRITVSAPGKLMILGDYAVIHNRPCLVTAVDQRMKTSVEILGDQSFELEAPDVKVSNYKKPLSELGKGDISRGARFVECAVRNIFEKYGLQKGIKIATSSEFSSKYGLGSSSASTVCVIKGISELFNLKLSNKDIFDLSYKTILDIQEKGSGFDIAASVYGGTLYFVTGGKTIKSLNIKDLPLVVGYSGIKADTVVLINKVKQKFLSKENELEEIYNQISILVDKAKASIERMGWDEFGKFMNKNQKLLIKLGVSIDKLDNMIQGANNAGAYGAKLSGAGGGDSMIAVCAIGKKEAVEKAIEEAGGEILKINSNAEGARVEK